MAQAFKKTDAQIHHDVLDELKWDSRVDETEAEEAGFAYKNLAAVVDVLHRLDLSRRVVSLTPIGNIEG
jgi:RNA-splicing ligase RtcB